MIPSWVGPDLFLDLAIFFWMAWSVSVFLNHDRELDARLKEEIPS